MDNPNPTVHLDNEDVFQDAFRKQSEKFVYLYDLNRPNDFDCPEITPEEVYFFIKNLNDPEHPLTLEQLRVVEVKNIHVNGIKKLVKVFFTPTIKHCSQATLIGLMIRVKLLNCLPFDFKVEVYISPGSHDSEDAVNKQLNDKERVAAALENSTLLAVINRGIANTTPWTFLDW